MRHNSCHEPTMGVPVIAPPGSGDGSCRWPWPSSPSRAPRSPRARRCSSTPPGWPRRRPTPTATRCRTRGKTSSAWIRTTRGTPPAIPTTTAGRTRRSSPPRRHPLGHHVRYFAEGSTGYFDTSVAVLNLSTTDTAHVALALLSESGGVVSHRFTLAPRQRQSVSINTVLGASGAVAIIVESDVAVAADRFMTWGTSGIGASLDSGASAPATTWYFAEGATGPFFLYYLLQNPATTPATVTVRYLVEGRIAGHPDAHAPAAEPHHDLRQRGRPGARPRVAGIDHHVGRADLRRTRDVPRRRRHARRRRGVGGIAAALDAVVLR